MMSLLPPSPEYYIHPPYPARLQWLTMQGVVRVACLSVKWDDGCSEELKSGVTDCGSGQLHPAHGVDLKG